MKRWRILGQPRDLVQSIASELLISPVSAQVLLNRRITDLKSAREFLNPKLQYLKDPFEIPNILTAARRVLLARERGEKVVIYGDYDVDGVTGTVILLETLEYLGLRPSYYIPFRYGEGYSLNKDAIKKIKDEGANLIITVDCGISSVIEIEHANSLGMDVIVTDHHNLPGKLPASYANVNPKMIKEEHPSKYLSGAGVAFKFAWALLRTGGITESSFLTSLLDLAALGTVADVVPLSDENRVITVCGLNIINQKKRFGIKYLAEAAGLNDKITIENINFGLAPRLNAAGRLEHAKLSVDLLRSKDPVEAKKSAAQLNGINIRRQGIGSDIQEEAFARVKSQDLKVKIIIVSGENWHPGVIGIVASRLAETFYRPAILVGINEGRGRGSARSVEELNVFELLNSVRDLFSDFGGHEAAAGFEIDPVKLPELEERLLKLADKMIDEEALIPKITVDAELAPEQITLGLISELDSLSPFGQGNPSPIFMTKKLQLKDIRTVGKDGSHLKLKFSNLEAIGFRMGELKGSLDFNKSYDIAYNLESNLWNGFETAQLSLVDIREAV